MDRRSKKQKLQAMADQNVSPNEAEIAKTKLATLPPVTINHQNIKFILQIHWQGSVITYTVGE